MRGAHRQKALLVERTQHGVAVRVEDHRRFAQGFAAIVAGPLCFFNQLAAMEADRKVAILESMPGEQQHDALLYPHPAVGNQLLQAREGDRRGRFAADPFGPDLGLGHCDLSFGNLLAPAAGRLERMHRLLP